VGCDWHPDGGRVVYPPEIGLAEGIYGGQRWLCDCCLTPSIAAATAFLAAGQINWFAIALTGMVAAVYGVIYFFSVQDTPPGKVYERSASSKGLDDDSKDSGLCC